MKLHPFGQVVRRLRRERDVVLYDMAKRLGLGSAELSSIEMGYKLATPAVISGISKMLCLTSAEAEELAVAAGQPLRDESADRAEQEKAIAEGRAFVSYAHQETLFDCPCNECRYAKGDPTNPDGSCAHDYLDGRCAYCDQPANQAQG